MAFVFISVTLGLEAVVTVIKTYGAHVGHSDIKEVEAGKHLHVAVIW